MARSGLYCAVWEVFGNPGSKQVAVCCVVAKTKLCGLGSSVKWECLVNGIFSIRVLFKYVEMTGGQFGYLLVQ